MKQKYNFNDLVNKKNQIDWDLFDDIQSKFFSKNKYNLKNRPEKHDGEKVTWEHIQNVVKSAKKIYLPFGIKRKNLILASLLHDIGKPYRNDDHGADSADIMDKLFERSKDYELIKLAVKHHMISQFSPKKYYENAIRDAIKNKVNTGSFVKLFLCLKKADVLRGRRGNDNDDLFDHPLKKTISEESRSQKKKFKEAIRKLKLRH